MLSVKASRAPVARRGFSGTSSAASSLQLSLNSGDSILRSSADDSNRHTHSTDDGSRSTRRDGSRSGRRKRKRRRLRAYTFSGGRPRH